MAKAVERFAVEGQGLRWLTWDEAEALPLRVKTSLALTRARSRSALRLLVYREPSAYARGYVFNV